MQQPSAEKLYQLVEQIPYGKVASYGQLAKILGFPKHARWVGKQLSLLPCDRKIPWHRVVNSKGEVRPRGNNGSDDFQRILLQEEGSLLKQTGRVDMKQFQMTPS